MIVPFHNTEVQKVSSVRQDAFTYVALPRMGKKKSPAVVREDDGLKANVEAPPSRSVVESVFAIFVFGVTSLARSPRSLYERHGGSDVSAPNTKIYSEISSFSLDILKVC